MNKALGKILGLIGLLALLLMAACSAGGAEPAKEQQGASQAAQAEQAEQAKNTVEPPSSPVAEQRVVSTTVAITQMLDALEVELVGVPTSSKTLPARYNKVTRVGNPMSPDMELVKSLKPTEILSVTTLEYDLKPVFEAAGMQADFLNLTSVESMNNALKKLGETYNKQAQAQAIIDKFEQKVAEIHTATAEKKKPSVLILLGVPGSYLVATEHSYIGDLVRLAGGVNIVQGEEVEYLASNTEYLQQSNPDVILRAAHGMPEEVVKMFDKEFQKNDIWKHFSAVQNGRVYDLEEALFGTTGNLYAVDAIDTLMGMLYP
ncbi:iron complex transport system substrate-binding protein [Paenibacillus algorifonticola]|uniref:High-affinity heme uptake system protein IsdE n=1 Tax=Paenibacillus algorifonticola TaxID=684063 RepID=A0A1I2F1C4_9BACL|nr:heme ABC transporter substrate-binding protein IsdE [Paenibacillus algorifonticola]SFE98498.1 iron complex transport system substrate-binding protein [Paenibacillus algorifonticola]